MVLLDAKQIVIYLVQGYVITDRENANFYCSIKRDGQEYNLYIGVKNEKTSS